MKRRQSLHWAGRSMLGDRSVQGDAFAGATWQPDEQPGTEGMVFSLADGMGAYEGSAAAARAAVTSSLDAFLAGKGDIESRLGEALRSANEAVADTKRRLSSHEDMGCTLIVAAVSLQRIAWVSVGDSLLWRLRGDEVMVLNRDHSMAAVLDQMAASGELSAEEASTDPRRGMLRSAVTGSEITLVDLQGDGVGLEPGDGVIIASDGLLRLQSDLLLPVLRSGKDPSNVVARTLELIDRNGRRPLDNTSIVVCRLDEPMWLGLRRWIAARFSKGKESAE